MRHRQYSFGILHCCDDGYDAPGAHAMREALSQARFNVVSVLPASDTSGSGGALGPIELPDGAVRKLDEDCYVLDTTPVGCVRWAMKGGVTLAPDFAVVTGVNKGMNLAMDIPHSGTVMAALYAAARGRLALAVSCQQDLAPVHLVPAAFMAVDWLQAHREETGLFSLNVPSRDGMQTPLLVDRADDEVHWLQRGQATIRRMGWLFHV